MHVMMREAASGQQYGASNERIYFLLLIYPVLGMVAYLFDFRV